MKNKYTEFAESYSPLLEVLHNIEKIVDLDNKVWTYKDKIGAIKYAILELKSNIDIEVQ